MADAPILTATPTGAGALAALVLADGTVIPGQGLGAEGTAVGEVCFNTSMTGYQEILTDPSYACQIISFTFPHIGNVGTNKEDMEATKPAACGLVVRSPITKPSNFRAAQHLDTWLKEHNLIGVSGVDTRSLTRLLRDKGPQSAVICNLIGDIDVSEMVTEAANWPGLEGMDLAKVVSCRKSYNWNQTRWKLDLGYSTQNNSRHHVVAVDFGIKHNILRCLAASGCRVTVVPATSTAEKILSLEPDGIFLSNGPGDPAATGSYAVPMIHGIFESGMPVFGICLGYQILALALGGTTAKMRLGHRGANHPVKDLSTGRVEITSQNHGFIVNSETLPQGVTATHISLFDDSLEGLKVEGKPWFGVQYHPEASPGPQDSHYLFERFLKMIEHNA